MSDTQSAAVYALAVSMAEPLADLAVRTLGPDAYVTRPHLQPSERARAAAELFHRLFTNAFEPEYFEAVRREFYDVGYRWEQNGGPMHRMFELTQVLLKEIRRRLCASLGDLRRVELLVTEFDRVLLEMLFSICEGAKQAASDAGASSCVLAFAQPVSEIHPRADDTSRRIDSAGGRGSSCALTFDLA